MMVQPRRVGVVGHSNYEMLGETLARLQAFAGRVGGFAVLRARTWRRYVGDGDVLTPEVCAELELVVTLGGDGTLLRGARMVAADGVPVLGINLGHLGFLTSAPREEIESALERWRAGDYEMDERMALAVHAEDGDGTAGKVHLALNDAVLHKGGAARVIRLSVSA